MKAGELTVLGASCHSGQSDGGIQGSGILSGVFAPAAGSRRVLRRIDRLVADQAEGLQFEPEEFLGGLQLVALRAS